MAQGAPKKASKANAPKTTQRKQSGARVIKPKKASLLKAQKAAKKHSAGLTALTEKAIANKAGHLELLGGGKKESKAEKNATTMRKVK